jgi:hypothetical protein
MEFFELCTRWLLFDFFLGSLKSCVCALPVSLPLSCTFLATLWDIPPIIATDPMQDIFSELHIRFLADLMVKNREDAVAASSLSLPGGHELWQ